MHRLLDDAADDRSLPVVPPLSLGAGPLALMESCLARRGRRGSRWLAAALVLAEGVACVPREALSSYADGRAGAGGSGAAPEEGVTAPEDAGAADGDDASAWPGNPGGAEGSDAAPSDAALADAAPPACPTPDALFDAVSSSCYRVVNAELAWTDAGQACGAWAPAAALALIDSARENDFLASAAPELTLWIGASDGDSDGSYVWPDGSAVSPSLGWEGTQPDEPARAGGNCVEMRAGTAGLWFDRPCSTLNAYVCELRP